MEKYYFEEHENAYQQMKARNIGAWDEYHEPAQYNYDHFMMRPFLEKALTVIDTHDSEFLAFEYGCGTGAGSSFLAQRGYSVDAIDISPTAISMANDIAAVKGLKINYKVKDLLELDKMDSSYDLILDNYCLQSIVTDEDRSKLYSLVSSGLKDSGYYILSSAIYNEARSYNNSYYCPETGIAYEKTRNPEKYVDAVLIHHEWWLPNRRHLKKEVLREELQTAGFNVIFQENGNFICKKG
ncbi:class I SAM-dependent methyltransferase [Paenibacillus sp. UNC451MF]|uniref:class I SAM-dependent methyltransferase n=1 Tax=Paenibacillus sp. UNC451MF TaxID=1449063 RepID=UPI000490DBAE|nr:class I SAM-dependent methyltransferase [Paenibacillus sp. UNC451MF]